MGETIVALDRDLSRFGPALKAAGFRVVDADDANVGVADVVVLDGLDDHVMGMVTTKFATPTVDATGRTADQVVAAVRQHLQDE
ncbi:MAG: YkuS family protein [Thermaerobacter sp.]|nr:YkuS family protein [Thermaerobacter sp.]